MADDTRASGGAAALGGTGTLLAGVPSAAQNQAPPVTIGNIRTVLGSTERSFSDSAQPFQPALPRPVH